MPYVSIVIPAYNAADFITDAYRSIADQTISDWEVIFVNDSSQDCTLSVVRSLAAVDKRIKVVDLALNLGPACARNAALAIAEGEWIAMLDADDRYSRDRLEVLTRAGEQSDADIVLDNLFIVDPISRDTIFLAFEPDDDGSVALKFSDFLRNIQSSAFFGFGYFKPVIRRHWLMANNIKYLEALRHGEDVTLLLECYARGAKVVLLSRPYYYYCNQYSHISRTKSPKTKTKARFNCLLAAVEQFLESYHSKLSHLERNLIASYCESLREMMIIEDLRSYLTNSDFIGIAGSLRNPVRLFKGIYFEKRRSLLHRSRARSFLRAGMQLTHSQGG